MKEQRKLWNIIRKDIIARKQWHVLFEEFGVDEETMFRIAEGFGFGMGMMDICGAVTGMFMVMGLDNSVGNPDNGKLTKADTYKKVKEYANRFKEKNGTYYCRELKSVVDGK